MGIKNGLNHSWKAWGHWNNFKEILALIGYWPFLPGSGGGAVMFIWTAAEGWSAPAVWLASLAAAALCAVIFAAIRIAIAYPHAHSDQKAEQDDAPLSLREQNAADLAAMGSQLSAAMDGAMHRLIHGSDGPTSHALISAKTAPIDKAQPELSSDRKRLKDDIWNLVEEGVHLRDEGIKTKTPASWRPRCLAWEARLINQVRLLSPDLARLLRPLNDCDPTKKNEKIVAGGKSHQMDVNAVSTIIRILREELPKIEA